MLAQYGYLQNNAFIRQFYQQVLLTDGLTLVLLALLLLGFVCCLRRLHKDKQALLLQVENSLMQFRTDSNGRLEQGEQQQTANKEHKLPRQPGDELSEQYVRQQVGRELPELERLNQQLAALAARPDIIFADEPTGNLDSKTSDEVMALLKMSAQKYGQTIVMITHDEEAAQLADRILVIEDGRVVQQA